MIKLFRNNAVFAYSIFFILLFSSFFSKSQCLSGNYTVGGNSPDFQTISSAAAALNNFGVCGPVNFKIRPGIYSEHIVVRKYVGASEANRVTFGPEQSDSLSVEIRDSSFSTPGLPEIEIDSASYLTFERLLFRDVRAFPGNMIRMQNGSNHNIVSFCTFFVRKTTIGSSNDLHANTTILLKGGGWAKQNNYNRIEHNYFQDGLRGVSFMTFNNKYDTGNVVANNVFIDQIYSGIYADHQKKLNVKANLIRSTVVPVSVISATNGIQLSALKDTTWIEGNRIYRKQGDAVFSLSVSDTCKVYVNNNYFFIQSNYTNGLTYSDGFVYESTSTKSKLELNYNTVRAVDRVRYPLSVPQNFGKIEAYNNNVIGDTCYTGFYYDFASMAGYTGANNNYSGTMTSAIRFLGTNYATSQAFFAATGKDSASISIRPRFSDDTGYILNDTSLVGLGTPRAITIDVDGILRDSLHPTIGCSEVAALKHSDVFMQSIGSSVTNCPGSQAVSINFKNLGLDTIQTLNIGWEIDGIAQSPFVYNGTLAPLQSLTNIVIGNFTSSAPFQLKVYPISINGVADEDHSNDTIVNVRTTGSLNGTYTIGSYQCDFPDVISAKNALQSGGICGPVKFRIKRGVYFGRMTFQNISGSSQVNTITFEPFNYEGHEGVVIYDFGGGAPSYGVVIELDHIKYFTLSKISIKAMTSNPQMFYGSGYLIDMNYCSNIIIDSCYIENPKAGFAANIRMLNSDSVLISNNKIYGGGTGIRVSSVNTNKALWIKSNVFEACSDGININSMNLVNIEKNILTGSLEVNQNTGTSGIKLEDVNGAYVSGNQVYKFGVGLYIMNVQSYLGQRSVLVNNMINMGASVNLLVDADILHNNINILEIQPSNYAAALNFQDCSGIDMYNNNLVNFRNAGNVGAMTWYSSTSSYPPFTHCDYNNYYSSVLGDTIWTLSLAGWTNLFHIDSNSVSIDPHYLSNTDLHVSDTLLMGIGKPIGISEDIDGNIRPSLPAIGADEITPGTLSQLGASVWPGDANNDLVADNQDLLQLGLQYGKTGTGRAAVCNLWQQFVSMNWNDTLQNGINSKHVDCNGDGIINMNDTLAINLNYGSMHTAKHAQPNKIATSNPDIYLQFNKSYYFSGDTVVAGIFIGTNSNPQTNFYGAAFTLNYNSANVLAGSEKFYFNNSWLGNINSTKIKLSKINAGSGTVDASLTRIDHQDVSGHGKVASFQFVLKDPLPSGELLFNITNAIKTDDLGVFDTLSSGIDSVAMFNNVTNIITYKGSDEVIIYPNPANDNIIVASIAEIGELSICNSLGELVFKSTTKNRQVQIDISGFSSGFYVVLINGKRFKLIKE